MDMDRRRPLIMIAVLTLITAGALIIEFSNDEVEDVSATPAATQVPSSQTNLNSGPSGSSDASESQEVSGRIVSIEFDKPSYNAGDKVKVSLNFENTGEADLTSEAVVIRAYCENLDSMLGKMALKTLSDEERSKTIRLKYTVDVKPGETGTLSASFQTDAEMEGVSLAGDYEVTVTLKGNGVTLAEKKLNLRLN
ncbi:MAG: hypothetical protein ACXQS6_03100 [Candidatus Syntropharchaeales archaeon]